MTTSNNILGLLKAARQLSQGQVAELREAASRTDQFAAKTTRFVPGVVAGDYGGLMLDTATLSIKHREPGQVESEPLLALPLKVLLQIALAAVELAEHERQFEDISALDPVIRYTIDGWITHGLADAVKHTAVQQSSSDGPYTRHLYLKVDYGRPLQIELLSQVMDDSPITRAKQADWFDKQRRLAELYLAAAKERK